MNYTETKIKDVTDGTVYTNALPSSLLNLLLDFVPEEKEVDFLDFLSKYTDAPIPGAYLIYMSKVLKEAEAKIYQAHPEDPAVKRANKLGSEVILFEKEKEV